MTTFARDHGAFLDAWCPHYRESSLLGVDPVANGFSLNDGWTPVITTPPNNPGGGGGGGPGGGPGGGGGGPGGGGGGPGGGGPGGGKRL